MTPFAPIIQPEVSVLMSCYNSAKWLHEAIESVLAQTFENFEFILVDDGSTDETWSIIQSYRGRDKRIVAISKNNTGLSDSLNIGLALARGLWIARLDADDLCEPTRLAEQVNYVHKHPEVVLLGSGSIEIDEHGNQIKTQFYPSEHEKLLLHLERIQRFFPHSSAFYHLGLTRQVGGYLGRFTRAEDKRLWLDLAMLGRIACIPKKLVRIRKHANQISSVSNCKLQFIDAVSTSVCHYLRKAGFKDPALNANNDDWLAFMNWLEICVETSGSVNRLNTWIVARNLFFSTESTLKRVVRFSNHILKSGHAVMIANEHLFGTSLPQILASEWMQRTCREGMT